jgi:hypothetical protein
VKGWNSSFEARSRIAKSSHSTTENKVSSLQGLNLNG